MHVAFKSNLETELINCITNIIKYISSNSLPKLMLIFFIGDMNRSLLHQNFEELKLNKKSLEIYTTTNNISSSLKDNNGNLNDYNVDNVLKVEFITK